MKEILKRSLSSCALLTVLGTCFSLTLAFAEDKTIRLGGNVAQANLLSQAKPVYPAEAKQNRIQGTVRLEITIDKEGHVANMSLVGGPAELVQSATDAVQHWLYKPTLLNGEPVSVVTTVDINYTLAQ